MRNASTSTRSGSGTSASTARRIASQRRLVDVDAIDLVGRRPRPPPTRSARARSRRTAARARPAAPAWSRAGRECAGRDRARRPPATTGPARHPRPTSSTPATCTNPTRRSAFSSVRIARAMARPLRRVATARAHGSARRLLLARSFMRAALPFRSRRKYSFARRTFADRTTSTFWMIGECSGKMRSTPWPNDTLRTVNDARAPPRCMPMTMPSKTWMRSLSPSRTFTCTRTVSPDFIAGRSVSCAFSTISIALMRPLPSSRSAQQSIAADIPLLVVERRAAPAGPAAAPASARAPRACATAGSRAWCPDSSTSGTVMPPELRRPRVVRVVEQPARERIRPTDCSSPTTPGTSRATASRITSAGSSPPVST